MKTTRWLALGAAGAALAAVCGCGQVPQAGEVPGGPPEASRYQVQQWDGGDRGGRRGGWDQPQGQAWGGGGLAWGPQGAFIEAANATSDNFNASGGTAFTAQRAIDEDWNTQWASLNMEDEATLTVAYNRPIDVNRLRIKTQPTEGSFYVVESSWDGSRWRRASGRLSGTDWRIREVPVDVSGRFLRIHWFRNGVNSPSLRHWSVFEVQAVPDSEGPYRGDGRVTRR